MNRPTSLLALVLLSGGALGQSSNELERVTPGSTARRVATETTVPGGSVGPMGAGASCASTIDDAFGGPCIPASATPTLGHLLPLGPDLFVDPAGRVGIGTTTPLQELHVQTSLNAVLRLASWSIFAQDYFSAIELGDTDFVSGYQLRGTSDAFTIWARRDTHGGPQFFGPHLSVLNHATTFVGVGTETPEATLDVDGDVVARDKIEIHKSDGSVGILLDPEYFGGPARIRTQVLEITGGADLAESFDTAGKRCEPGTVLVIDDQRPGELKLSDSPYDVRVAGVVSGAGGVRAGLHLGQQGLVEGETPVALTGRVYVRCNEESGPIRPGDRLTTSSRPGEAMRVADRDRAIGAVIGKAMTTLDRETGLVLVLIGLQ